MISQAWQATHPFASGNSDSCISFQHERLPPRHIISWHPLQEPPEGLKIDAVSGRTARRLVENIIAGTYKEPVRPYRVVYIFWGGNDLGPRDRRTITRDVFRLWDDIEYLVAHFETFVQAVVVLCPIPRPRIGRHNQQMLETAETLLRAKLGRKKSVLMFKHFDPDRHFVDGIHLNKAGYTVLRRRLLRQ